MYTLQYMYLCMYVLYSIVYMRSTVYECTLQYSCTVHSIVLMYCTYLYSLQYICTVLYSTVLSMYSIVLYVVLYSTVLYYMFSEQYIQYMSCSMYSTVCTVLCTTVGTFNTVYVYSPDYSICCMQSVYSIVYIYTYSMSLYIIILCCRLTVPLKGYLTVLVSFQYIITIQHASFVQ